MSSGQPDIKILAVIAVHNEADYLRVLLPLLAAQSIDVAIVDNSVCNEVRSVLEDFWRAPIVDCIRQPFDGRFSLSRQLQLKRELVARPGHDWIVHHDADEVLEGVEAGMDLRALIEHAEAQGANCINFREFVFLPREDEDFSGRDYFRGMLRYYLFEPKENRLNRAWRADLSASNLEYAGHFLVGDGILRLEEDQVLRHYPVLSMQHAKAKYLRRLFAEEDLSKGWHKTRLGITEAGLTLPSEDARIHELPHYNARPLLTSTPATTHFWEWR